MATFNTFKGRTLVQMKIHANQLQGEIEHLRHLLSMHRCLSDGAMTVGQCNLSRRCGCSCFGQFPPPCQIEAATP